MAGPAVRVTWRADGEELLIEQEDAWDLLVMQRFASGGSEQQDR